jgi:hypothetical protein
MKIRVALFAAVLAAGCASRPAVPKQPMLQPPQAIALLAEQDSKITSATGEGSVLLTRADGQSVRLDTVVVAQFPDRVRLRAWKMGQAVFDLTLTPDGVWMLVADKSRREKILTAGANAAQFMRGWSSLHAGFFTDPNLKIIEETPELLVLERPIEGGQRIRAVIDRGTLTIREHSVLDDKGVSRFTLTYDRYQMVNGFPWPMRLRAQGEQGQIEVSFDEVQLNQAPPAGAFTPPKRAEKLQ